MAEHTGRGYGRESPDGFDDEEAELIFRGFRNNLERTRITTEKVHRLVKEDKAFIPEFAEFFTSIVQAFRKDLRKAMNIAEKSGESCECLNCLYGPICRAMYSNAALLLEGIEQQGNFLSTVTQTEVRRQGLQERADAIIHDVHQEAIYDHLQQHTEGERKKGEVEKRERLRREALEAARATGPGSLDYYKKQNALLVQEVARLKRDVAAHTDSPQAEETETESQAETPQFVSKTPESWQSQAFSTTGEETEGVKDREDTESKRQSTASSILGADWRGKSLADDTAEPNLEGNAEPGKQRSPSLDEDQEKSVKTASGPQDEPGKASEVNEPEDKFQQEQPAAEEPIGDQTSAETGSPHEDSVQEQPTSIPVPESSPKDEAALANLTVNDEQEWDTVSESETLSQAFEYDDRPKTWGHRNRTHRHGITAAYNLASRLRKSEALRPIQIVVWPDGPNAFVEQYEAWWHVTVYLVVLLCQPLRMVTESIIRIYKWYNSTKGASEYKVKESLLWPEVPQIPLHSVLIVLRQIMLVYTAHTWMACWEERLIWLTSNQNSARYFRSWMMEDPSFFWAPGVDYRLAWWVPHLRKWIMMQVFTIDVWLKPGWSALAAVGSSLLATLYGYVCQAAGICVGGSGGLK